MSINRRIDNIFNPFRLDDRLLTSLPFIIRKPLLSVIEKILALNELANEYDLLPACDTSLQFASQALQHLNVKPEIVSGTLGAIPQEGPVVVVANHPFGGIEGIILIKLLQQIRPDVRIMANSLLKRVPELSDTIIGVNPYGHARAKRENIKPLREAVRWLKSGGLLVVFPSGDVSRLHLSSMSIRDDKWDAGIARLIRMTNAKVVPIHIAGRNSTLFHMTGLIHPLLRSLMLPRELANKRNTIIELRIGEVINSKHVLGKGSDDDIAKYLRLHTYMLARPVIGADKQAKIAEAPLQPIAAPISPTLLHAEVHALPSTQALVENNDLKIYYAEASQIPWDFAGNRTLARGDFSCSRGRNRQD